MLEIPRSIIDWLILGEQTVVCGVITVIVINTVHHNVTTTPSNHQTGRHMIMFVIVMVSNDSYIYEGNYRGITRY